MSISRSFKVWWAALLLFIQDSFVYRANAFIWMMTDTVTAVTMPLIWLSSYNGRHDIHGFNQSQMVVYYLVVLAVGSIVESHSMWEINYLVKEGKFSAYVIRPMSFMAYTYAGNLGWRMVRTGMGLPVMAAVVFAFHRYIPATMHVQVGPLFWISVVLGHLMSFMITYPLGLLSLWLYEVRSFYNFYYLPAMIFSGQIAPVALFPHGMQWLFRVLPFPYTISFPANVFLGRLTDVQIFEGFGVQLAWISVGFVCSALLWRGGLKRYTAFGI